MLVVWLRVCCWCGGDYVAGVVEVMLVVWWSDGWKMMVDKK